MHGISHREQSAGGRLLQNACRMTKGTYDQNMREVSVYDTDL